MPTESTMLDERARPSKANREGVDLDSSNGCHQAPAEAPEIRS
jgi:hypothetical protein